MIKLEPEIQSTTKAPLLSFDRVCLSFGAIQVLQEVSFSIKQGDIVAIIGPNGAGKTSVLNCMSGFYRPSSGQIMFKGQDLTRLPSHRVAEMGMGRTFQQIELFSDLTALENLMVGRHTKLNLGILWGALFFGKTRREELSHRRYVEEIIDLLEMQHIRNTPAGILPYGLRKRVELGRALAMEPSLLLLDEPMAGMNVEEKEDMARFILDVHELKQVTMVLIEHDIGLVMDIADRVVVLDFGQKIADGTPETIKNDPKVIQAYLGAEA